MKKFLSAIFCLGLFTGQAQIRVYFQDKEFSQGEVNAAGVALSPKALERRAAQNIALDESDMPVPAHFLQELKAAGAHVLAQSRWLNYALVEGVDMQTALSFSFVKSAEDIRGYRSGSGPAAVQACNQLEIEYGKALNQMEMVQGNFLHSLGYLGQGMTIAVLDGGFAGTESSFVFDSLWTHNRIRGTYNFAAGDTNVYRDGSHGSKVLSILGGYIDSVYSGSAPRADYWLLKSEVESSEFAIEMDYWVMAAEYADSVGADIITSSLGYNEFQNGEGDLSYAQMDGNTAIVTKAADMAAQKGILVVVSAGNEGNTTWKHITAPADGDSVMAVGAVDTDGIWASFSGIGPSADGRIKPDVMAQGQGTAFASGSNVYTGNGTSFSCPVISGLAACLWQVNKTKSNMDLFAEIVNSAHQRYSPDNYYGYGIPNFQTGFYSIDLRERAQPAQVEVFPNPVKDQLNIRFTSHFGEKELEVTLYDFSGRILATNKYTRLQERELQFDFIYPEGAYLLQVKQDSDIFIYKILK